MSEATLTTETVIDALKSVYDPEIPINIVDLGLVYNVEVDNGEVCVQMTLTTSGCPMGAYIARQAEWRVADLDGVEDVTIDLVWDPPWSVEKITDAGKKLLGLA